jgi:5'-deoxynucleotidase YfbR-like HD superfamily hydrolase
MKVFAKILIALVMVVSISVLVSLQIQGTSLAAEELGKKEMSAAPPPITKEEIQERIKELEKQKRQAEANANAFAGAIQDCEFWLEQLKQAEEAKNPQASFVPGSQYKHDPEKPDSTSVTKKELKK